MVEEIGTEAGYSWDLIPEVHITRRFEHFLLRTRSDLVEQVVESLVVEHYSPRQAFQFTVDAKGRDLSCNQMKVRRPVFDHHAKEFIDFRHCSRVSLRSVLS
ncbi:MAG: hypothetical protein CAF42_002215 [Nitrospira sp. CG24B]|nr:MAG: hypothetical protein CAF42_002215 [Nitrospira sp. CG24B]